MYTEDTDTDVIDGAVRFVVTLRFESIPEDALKFVNKTLVVVILVDLIWGDINVDVVILVVDRCVVFTLVVA